MRFSDSDPTGSVIMPKLSNDTKILNITNEIEQFSTKIDYFLNKLNYEKKYFESIDYEMIKNSLLVVVAIKNNEIVGITGMEKRYFIMKSYIMISNEYQGKRIGKKILNRIINETRKKYNLIMAVIKEANIKAQELYFKMNAKHLGNKDGHNYCMIHFNFKGKVIFYLIKTIFPILKLKDWFLTR